ncbi:MAG TPA: hypothetical protein VLX92_04280 [Kofleriaceae bacterium]|nr:hypothetical protein [Kofleriaceae bacterium]
MSRRAVVIGCAALAWSVAIGRSWLALQPFVAPAEAASPPPSYRVVALDPSQDGDCPGPMLREIHRHPHWTIRLDAIFPRDCGMEPLIRDASITITADGAQWIGDGRRLADHAWVGTPRTEPVELTDAERAGLLAALDRPCDDLDAGDGRWWFAIAIDPASDPITSLPRSQLSADVARMFDALERRYVAAEIGTAREVRLDVSYRSGHRRDRARIARGRLDHGADTPELLDDAQLVYAVHCLRELPHDRDPVVTGTWSLQGVRVPIAVGPDGLDPNGCLCGLDICIASYVE